MTDRRREFVATELWLLVAVLTLPLSGVAALAGLGATAAVIAVLGWFLLTPVLLFWGDDVAALLFGGSESTAEGEADPLDELKRRYAEGEVGDEEFERRLDRLLESDAVEEDATASGPVDGAGVTATGSDPNRPAGPEEASGTDHAEGERNR